MTLKKNVVLLAALAGAAVSATAMAAVVPGSGPEQGPREPGPHAYLRANGVDPNAKKTSAVTPHGRFDVQSGQRGEVCVSSAKGATKCADEGLVERGIPPQVAVCVPGLPPKGMELTGIAPKGVTEVRLVADGKTLSTAATTAQGYTMNAPIPNAPESARLVFTPGDGTVDSLPIPPQANEVVCG